MLYGLASLFGVLALLGMQLPVIMADCPLDLTGSNFTLASSICSNRTDRGRCCRFINANIAISVARFANATTNLGVPPDASDICLQNISQTLHLSGVTKNATVFCGFGAKIPVNYECKGRTTVMQMLQSPRFEEVTNNCKVPLGDGSKCKKCLNAGIGYLHHLGIEDNITLSTCRDATFAALASQVDEISTIDIASCFFGVQGLIGPIVSESSPSLPAPEASPSPLVADSPSPLLLRVPLNGNHHSYHLTLVPGIAIAVTVVAVIMLLVLIVLIRQKSRELDEPDNFSKTSSKTLRPCATWKFQEGSSSMFRKFNYREIKKATEDFSTIIGQGGFGTVYKAQFSDDLVVAVKRMDRVSEQAEDEFCREIELLARLHHRHLVALRGFCIKKHERYQFLCAFLWSLTSYTGKSNPFSCLMAGFCCMSTWEMEA